MFTVEKPSLRYLTDLSGRGEIMNMKPPLGTKTCVRAAVSHPKVLGSSLSSPIEPSRRPMRSRKSIVVSAVSDSISRSNICLSSSALLNPAPSHDPGVVPPEGSLPEYEADFAELEDGTLVELIEDPNKPANSTFVVFSNSTVRFAAKVERADRVLVPVPRGR